jgi:hypothetical protein
VGSDAKAELAKAHGCAHTIVYTRENFVDRVKEITGGKGVPVVYDSVGKDTFPASLDCLAPRGLFVSFGSSSGPIAAFNLGMLGPKGSLYATRPTLFTYAAKRADLLAMSDEMFGLVREGKIEADARQTFALKDAADAHRALESRATTGATLLIPSPLAARPAALTRSRAASANAVAETPSGPMPRATSASAAAPCAQTPMRWSSGPASASRRRHARWSRERLRRRRRWCSTPTRSTSSRPTRRCAPHCALAMRRAC